MTPTPQIPAGEDCMLGDTSQAQEGAPKSMVQQVAERTGAATQVRAQFARYERVIHGCESCDGEPECTCRPPVAPQVLHPATADLVRRFSDALAEKLLAAQTKYGYSDGWLRDDWMDECRKHLLNHVIKGDPRDVAAYCAFLWHHSAKTFVPTKAAPYEDLMNEVMACGGEVTPREIIFDHGTFDIFMQRQAGKTALERFADDVQAALSTTESQS